MRDKYFPFLVLFTAILVSCSAAYYSVFGLSKLFAGASFEVIIMAGSLELAKVVSASLLQQYWSSLHVLKRIYLFITVFVLIVITSAGIYGFLSSAYQITSNKDSIFEKRIEILESKKNRYVRERDEYIAEKTKIISDITQLRTSLSNPNQIQYIHPTTKQIISTTSSSARKSLENQLDDAINRRDLLSNKIDIFNDSVSNYESRIIDSKASTSTSSELGPLKYLSGLTGKPMDVIVNWFLILIVFVFDPLAIVLFVTANFLFTRKQSLSGDRTLPPIDPLPVKGSIEPEDSHQMFSDSMLSKSNSEDISGVHSIISGSYPVGLDNSNNWKIAYSGSIFDENNINYDVADDHIVDDNIPIHKSDVPVITVERIEDDRSRKILDDGLSRRLADNIRKALPWWKPVDTGSLSSKSIDDTLTERQIQNMSHEEVQEWYKKRRVKS